MEKARLNHFILWCKNWYEPVNKKGDILTQAQKILVLDGYLICNNPIVIALNYIDELVDKEVIKPIRLAIWNRDITSYMIFENMNYDEALLYKIRSIFAFDCTNLSITPPVYSRKLYKMGFVAPKHFGNSYKLINYKVNKFFNRKQYYKKKRNYNQNNYDTRKS
jgi:hypothetical protein